MTSAPTRRELSLSFEPVQAQAMCGIAPVVETIGETTVSFGGIGSFVNRGVGMGLTRDPTDAELDAVDAFFASRGVIPRLELTTFAGDALLRRLADRGYTLLLTTELLVRALSPADASLDPGPSVSRVDLSDERAVLEQVTAAASGFRKEGEPVPQSDIDTMLVAARTAGTELWVARDGGGAPVGGGSVTVRDGVAALYGTSVLPSARGQGLHLALIRGRLRAGAEAGATIATVISAPAATTERNALRAGFTLGYARLYLVRRAPGLV